MYCWKNTVKTRSFEGDSRKTTCSVSDANLNSNEIIHQTKYTLSRQFVTEHCYWYLHVWSKKTLIYAHVHFNNTGLSGWNLLIYYDNYSFREKKTHAHTQFVQQQRNSSSCFSMCNIIAKNQTWLLLLVIYPGRGSYFRLFLALIKISSVISEIIMIYY